MVIKQRESVEKSRREPAEIFGVSKTQIQNTRKKKTDFFAAYDKFRCKYIEANVHSRLFTRSEACCVCLILQKLKTKFCFLIIELCTHVNHCALKLRNQLLQASC